MGGKERGEWAKSGEKTRKKEEREAHLALPFVRRLGEGTTERFGLLFILSLDTLQRA